MATIGSMGDLVFSVSRRVVKTFDGMQWETGARYASHDRHLKSTLLEFVGIEAETMSFTLLFSVFLGTNPESEIDKLDKMITRGKIFPVVLGRKRYGRYKWVIEKASKGLERFDNKGNLLHAKVTVNLKGYDRR